MSHIYVCCPAGGSIQQEDLLSPMGGYTHMSQNINISTGMQHPLLLRAGMGHLGTTDFSMWKIVRNVCGDSLIVTLKIPILHPVVIDYRLHLQMYF